MSTQDAVNRIRNCSDRYSNQRLRVDITTTVGSVGLPQRSRARGLSRRL